MNPSEFVQINTPTNGASVVVDNHAVDDGHQRRFRVQLIHPPQRISVSNLISAVAIPPLGLAYLCASLEDRGFGVSVIDGVGDGLGQIFRCDGRSLQGLTFEQIIDRIDPEADLIGIGVMFSCSWPPVRELIHRIKARYAHIPIVLGGEHATALPHLVFEQAPIDYVVMGEGEETLLALCDRLDRGGDLGDVDGLAVRDGTLVKINQPRRRIREVDDIPLPAWHHFDVGRYIDHRQPHGSADGRSMPLLATRGCPYQCTFCSSPGMWGTTWRPREVSKVVDEMELYAERYGANDFHFEDLTAVVRRDWILDFCNELIRRNLNVSWQLPSGTRSEAIDAEVSRAMYAAGCRQFSYALESGSPEMLKKIKKKIHLDKAFESARSAMAAGIRVQCIFIYGFPGETWRQMAQTYATIIRCALRGFSEVSICALSPLPNTEILRDIESEREFPMTDDYFDSIFGYLSIWQQRSWNARVPSVVLRFIILASFASFFATSFVTHPKRIFGLLRGLFSSTSGGKLARVLKGIVGNAIAVRRRQATSA